MHGIAKQKQTKRSAEQRRIVLGSTSGRSRALHCNCNCNCSRQVLHLLAIQFDPIAVQIGGNCLLAALVVFGLFLFQIQSCSFIYFFKTQWTEGEGVEQRFLYSCATWPIARRNLFVRISLYVVLCTALHCKYTLYIRRSSRQHTVFRLQSSWNYSPRLINFLADCDCVCVCAWQLCCFVCACALIVFMLCSLAENLLCASGKFAWIFSEFSQSCFCWKAKFASFL